MKKTKTVIELYPEITPGCWGLYDYTPIVDSFGEVVLRVDDDSYQGDSRVLYKRGRKYGFLMFGWGSCSGCDALQACQTIEEAQELIDELYSQVKWWDTKKKALDWFLAHDWDGDFSHGSAAMEAFLSKAVEILSNGKIVGWKEKNGKSSAISLSGESSAISEEESSTSSESEESSSSSKEDTL